MCKQHKFNYLQDRHHSFLPEVIQFLLTYILYFIYQLRNLSKLIRVNEKVSPEFFYLYLNEGQENGLLYQYKSNSANGINNFAFETFIDEVKITIPKETELKAFTEKVKPIFTLISTLGEQNSKLREARDILLPKLMNGQIEV